MPKDKKEKLARKQSKHEEQKAKRMKRMMAAIKKPFHRKGKGAPSHTHAAHPPLARGSRHGPSYNLSSSSGQLRYLRNLQFDRDSPRPSASPLAYRPSKSSDQQLPPPPPAFRDEAYDSIPLPPPPPMAFIPPPPPLPPLTRKAPAKKAGPPVPVRTTPVVAREGLPPPMQPVSTNYMDELRQAHNRSRLHHAVPSTKSPKRKSSRESGHH